MELHRHYPVDHARHTTQPAIQPKDRAREKGAMIALFAIALPVLIGGAGLVMDTGALYDLRRQVQAAADASAITGAQELRLGNSDAITKQALRTAEDNGFVSAGTTKVAVNMPPSKGRYAGDKNYVEVIVRGDAPSFFMQALTNRTFPVEGRAVAGVAANNTCTWTLDPSAKNSLNVTGSASVAFTDCGVYVASNNSSAARTNGKATLSAPSIDVVGNYSGTGFTPKPTTGASQYGDPFADLPAPDTGACKYTNTAVKTATTLNPGVYCGGIALNAKADVTLKPGVYVLMGGGITVNGSAKVKGSDVTFFNTGNKSYKFGGITMNGGADVVLSAPTSGPTKGMLFFDDRTQAGTTHTFNGGATVTLTGAVYFPESDLKLAGNFDAKTNNMILAVKNLSITGNVTFRKQALASLPPILAVARVVE